jgi:hypothetical protein
MSMSRRNQVAPRAPSSWNEGVFYLDSQFGSLRWLKDCSRSEQRSRVTENLIGDLEEMTDVEYRTYSGKT